MEDGFVVVGDDDGDNGTLLIEDDGHVENFGVLLGIGAGSIGHVTLSGPSASLSTGRIDAGYEGEGHVLVEAGASLQTSQTSIGAQEGSIASVRITGAGSTWTSSDFFDLGNNGSGTLEISDGGTLSTSSIHLARFEGSSASIEIGGIDEPTTGGTLDVDTISFGDGDGGINFHQTDAVSVSADIDGHGTITQHGTGITTLIGDNTYTGDTTISSGILAAAGTALGTSAVHIEGGTLAVGGLGATAPLTIASLDIGGDFSTLALELGPGGAHDTLIVTQPDGLALGGGTFILTLLDGYMPAAGMSFDLFDWTGGASGNFFFLDLAALDNGLAWETSNLYSNGTLSIVAIPEPSPAALVAAVLLTIAAFHRRKAGRPICPGINGKMAPIAGRSRGRGRGKPRSAGAGSRRGKACPRAPRRARAFSHSAR